MKLNIFAFVVEAFGGHGGIAQYNRDLIGAFAHAAGIKSVFVAPRRGLAPATELPAKVVLAPPRFGRMVYAVRALCAVFWRRPDVLFCGHLYMAPLAFFAARAIRRPYLVQLHGIEIWRRPTRWQVRALEGAATIFCVSRDTRARVLRHTRADPNRVVVVPNTFGPEYCPGDRAAARAAFGLGEAFALLTIGRLDSREQYKGHDRVLETLSRLPKSGRPEVYLISGEGDDWPRLEALAAKLGVQDRVRFLGFTPRDALPDLYRAADLFVMPSTGEGFGIVFLEAMASGTPALGLAVGGATDPLDFDANGSAVTDAEFEDALRLAIARPRPDAAVLHAAVSARFGREVFAQVAAAQIERIGLSR